MSIEKVYFCEGTTFKVSCCWGKVSVTKLGGGDLMDYMVYKVLMTNQDLLAEVDQHHRKGPWIISDPIKTEDRISACIMSNTNGNFVVAPIWSYFNDEYGDWRIYDIEHVWIRDIYDFVWHMGQAFYLDCTVIDITEVYRQALLRLDELDPERPPYQAEQGFNKEIPQ